MPCKMCTRDEDSLALGFPNGINNDRVCDNLLLGKT